MTELTPGRIVFACVCVRGKSFSFSFHPFRPPRPAPRQTCLKQLMCSGIYRKIYYLKDKIKFYIVYSLGQTLRINVILLNCRGRKSE